APRPSLAPPSAPPRGPHAFPTRRSSDLAVLDRTGGVAILQLRPQAHVRRRRQPGQPDQWRVAERGLQGFVTRHRVLEPRRFSARSEEHTSELQSRFELVCRLLLEQNKAE